ncbi:MAG: hypothetical protein COU10_01595 [Candidatus Harrisonbacteria bacterium CG10_big_fil_rev_8_21_14_0_10_45_28]|uniref:Radical SAM core domain-containing protein n=1 Tax=Candidatus Harrisonbacteria bacterium CG10_big_fil_rev_8_21_14_0_10_45_28 TaxID=1974586 RepID=A0A2H0UNK9_9BACT|nr:MAG: hypothetical protein COU10_01595 [Candidatus Harrisonbacteria bacterium CG10_big_fil_rev_8_21_14_0_10_45_28]
MRTSKHVRLIEDGSGFALSYHALFGNLQFLEPEYVRALKSLAMGAGSEGDVPRPILAELIEEGYVIEEGADERAILKRKNEEWMKKVVGGGQLRLLNLIISEACNLACAHCLHTCSLATSASHGSKKLMDWGTAKKAIDAYIAILARWGIKEFNVHFGAAEPLLNWRVLRLATEYLRRISPSALIAVNTNLTLLDREKAEFLRDHQVYIATSLDGPPAGNDAIRVRPNGAGTAEQILTAFRLLENIGYPLDGFSITIKDKNLPSLDYGFIEWAKNHGFKGVATDVDLVNQSGSQLSLAVAIAKLMELRRACIELGLENFGTWTTPYFNLVNEPEDEMPTFCKAIKGRNLSVNPEGAVFICGHTSTPLGKLEQLETVFAAGSPYVRLVESRLPGNDPMCFDCELEGICAGQCQITREVSQSTGSGKDSLLCQFYRQVTRALLEDKLVTERTTVS